MRWVGEWAVLTAGLWACASVVKKAVWKAVMTVLRRADGMADSKAAKKAALMDDLLVVAMVARSADTWEFWMAAW